MKKSEEIRAKRDAEIEEFRKYVKYNCHETVYQWCFGEHGRDENGYETWFPPKDYEDHMAEAFEMCEKRNAIYDKYDADLKSAEAEEWKEEINSCGWLKQWMA